MAAQTSEQFSAQLRAEGFNDLVVVEREANSALDPHRHPFESKALILAGELALNIAGRETIYRTGEIFHLDHHQLHAERYGPDGVRYLVGRR
jgi:quercetin dioxygenase-like cupin family protein